MKSVIRQEETICNAQSLFRQNFGAEPEWKTVAPGRVNLLGEHTDYNFLPVLPMTLERSISFYCRQRADSLVKIVNADKAYEAAVIDLDQPVTANPGHWTNYMRAALQAVVPVIHSQTPHPVRGFDVVIESNLPAASGLSSSSALVIGTCLSLLQANGLHWPARDVADRMRQAEQYVGTAGGGMDQAIIALGEKASALLIEFDPLTTTNVSLPEGLTIFVVNSGQRAEKTGPARFAYNRRALECDLAVAMLAKADSGEYNGKTWQTLADVYRSCTQLNLPWSYLLLKHLPLAAPTVNDVIQWMGQDVFTQLCQNRQLPADNTVQWLPSGRLEVFNRAAHILAEADRVYAFKAALEASHIDVACELARASHASCRDLYHISTPELEAVARKITDSGAAAARITGAGFGGCLVAYVPQQFARDFPAKLHSLGIPAQNIIRAKPDGPARIEILHKAKSAVSA